MGIGFREILIIAIVVILLFGRGKISEMMGDVAKGIKSFKKGLSDDETATPEAPAAKIEGPQPSSTPADKQADRQP
jgi:sec-independent protein translocase protein TatA